jgi:acetyl-CoA decarbonylase/synthase complex subunit delta
MAKQLNILLGNMDVKGEQIVMDPMTGALGYGLEYSYSVMERIRLTALGGDKMLAGPMILSPGVECSKTKELKAEEAQFPLGASWASGPCCGNCRQPQVSSTPEPTSWSCITPRRPWQ